MLVKLELSNISPRQLLKPGSYLLSSRDVILADSALSSGASDTTLFSLGQESEVNLTVPV